MQHSSFIQSRIKTLAELKQVTAGLKALGKKVVFTNGVFDLLHEGHISALCEAADAGDFLVVAVNGDASVKRLKGETRPVNNENSRALILASLLIVDAVIIFHEDTPLELIRELLPDVLVKGGDYTIAQIVGAKEVIANGGQVIINPIKEGFSTTGTIEKLKS
ncbi:MAG TPA: D-glycero-beta-D-manno-heptose 1-phosphate adenylyltransferase [Chitinophagaceae bacterium]